MAAKKEIEEHLKIALKEVGEIKPWFDKNYKCWLFSHPLYPVEYDGETREEVIENFPKYMREFIKQRLNDNIADTVEKRTFGHGGKRENHPMLALASFINPLIKECKK